MNLSRITRTALLGSLVAGSSIVQAQDLTLATGTPVRLWAATPALSRFHTSFVGYANDTLVVRDTGASALLRVPVGQIRIVEVSVARSRGGGALRGAGIGALAGSLVGLAFFGAAMSTCPPDDDGTCIISVMAIPVLGGIGIPIGAMFGAASPGHRWQPVQFGRR